MTLWWKLYDALETALAVLMLSVCVLTVLVAAVGRSAGSPVQSAPQIALLFLIWAVVFGADLCLRKGEHIRVSAIPDLLPLPLRRAVTVLNLALILPFLGFLAFEGYDLATGNWERELGSTGLSYGLVTLALPVGAVLFLVSVLRRLFRHGLDATLEPEDGHRESPL